MDLNDNDLNEIEDELKQFVNQVKNSNLSQDAINQLIDEIFDDKLEPLKNDGMDHENNNNKLILLLKNFIFFMWFIIKIVIFVIIGYVFISLHSPTQKFLLRNSQDLIYPVMRQIRLWTLPVIEKYNHLSHWHVEECLLTNPFYVGSKLDCWPCEDVRTIVDLTGLNNYSKAYCNNEKPFIVKDVMNSSIGLSQLKQIYFSNQKALDFGTAKIELNLQSVSLKSFNNFITDENMIKNDFHLLWKMNRVEAARVIRKYFIRPHFVPNTSEVALQRFIFIDGPDSPQYRFPLTDFANVWLTQADGFRLIVLDPSDLCKSNCSAVSIVLHPKDVLYYNWQFWRPRSLPARLTDDLSITFMSSFY